MARGSRRKNRPAVAEAARALDRFKYEIASEINLPSHLVQSGYWGNIPSAQCGAVGGHMVRKMIEAAERSLMEQTAVNVKAGFKAGLGADIGATPSAYNLPANLPAQNVGQQPPAGFQTTNLQ